MTSYLSSWLPSGLWGGKSKTVAQPSTAGRGWWGWGRNEPNTASPTTQTKKETGKSTAAETTGADTAPAASETPIEATVRETVLQHKRAPAAITTVPPSESPTNVTSPATRPTQTTKASGWFSRSPTMFRDDRGWFSPWMLTSHRAVNDRYSWKDLGSDQVKELYELHSGYYAAKKPDQWGFASEASKYLNDSEQADQFYGETVFAGGRVPKELTTLPSGDYEVARRLIKAADHVGTQATKQWAKDTQIAVDRRDIASLMTEVSKLRRRVSELEKEKEKKVSQGGTGAATADTSGAPSTAPGSVRFKFGQPESLGGQGTAETSNTRPTAGSTAPTAGSTEP